MDTNIPSAETLLQSHLERITTDVEHWLELLAPDVVVEFPYASALGTPGRLEGHDALRRYFRQVVPELRDFSFRDVRSYPSTDPEVAVMEVHGSAFIPSTGQRYEQDYVMIARARDGKIVEYREYWDPTAVAQALGIALGESRS